MEENFRRYPIGIQNFEQLREDNYVYVDKTALIYKLANTNTTYFLSRPAVLERACWFQHSNPISKERKNCSKDWRWKLWKKSGLSFPFYT